VGWIVAIIIIALAILAGILFLNRFYKKSTPETALVRTGAGGRRTVIDGGCLALPILHRIQKVNMRASPVLVQLSGNRSAISEDRLRVELEMEFLIRIDATPEGVASAAQSLGSRVSRPEELATFVESYLIDAMQAVAAARTLDSLHEDRQAFVEAVRGSIVGGLGRIGLVLETVALRHVDQAPFASLDENNAFNAVGMRRLSEVISDNRKERVKIETEADVAVRQSQLEQTRQRLDIERQQKQSEVEMRREAERMEAEADADIARIKAAAEREAFAARIDQEQAAKEAEIKRDQMLRQREMEALLDLESRKIDNAIEVASKRVEETNAQAKMEAARASVVEATEAVQTKKDLAVAARAKDLALLKAKQDAEVDTESTKSRVGTLLSIATAEADAARVTAEADKQRLVAESEGRAALIKAENTTSEALIGMKIEMHRLNQLPEIVTQMMKPVEKIDSIRINHIGGFGSQGSGGDGNQSPLNHAMESILGMALQLPAMKSMGEEIGVGFDANLAGRVSDATSRSKLGDAARKPNDKTGKT